MTFVHFVSSLFADCNGGGSKDFVKADIVAAPCKMQSRLYAALLASEILVWLSKIPYYIGLRIRKDLKIHV